MSNLKKIKKSLWLRLKSPSPDFFIKIQRWCIFMTFACGAVSSYLLTDNPDSKIGLSIASFAGFIGVFGTILAKLPIDESKITEGKQ